MKFSVSSKLLYSALSGVSKVINSKNTLTVLDNFLFELDAENNILTVTASDTENTLIGFWPTQNVCATLPRNCPTWL